MRPLIHGPTPACMGGKSSVLWRCNPMRGRSYTTCHWTETLAVHGLPSPTDGLLFTSASLVFPLPGSRVVWYLTGRDKPFYRMSSDPCHRGTNVGLQHTPSS